jgi:aminoglycoside phosphotransferase (APT) family kinase protein
VPTPSAVTPIAGGWDTQIWRVSSADCTYALRVFRAEQLNAFKREAAVMRVVRAGGLPVPKVHAEGVSGGRPALLLSWCPGLPLLAAVRAQPWRVWSLGVALGQMHARIHALPVPAALTNVVPIWDPGREDLAANLLARLQQPASTSLLHLDYHPLNVMVDGEQVTGVLDWANVAVGDRRADLARTVTLMRLPPLPPGTPAIVQLVMRPLLEAAWRSGYRELQMVDPFVDMAPFYAWAGTMMQRDLRPKLGRPGVWLRERDLARMQRWTLAWKKQNR